MAIHIAIQDKDDLRNMTRFYSTFVQRLVYSASVQPNSKAKQSVCSTSLDENAVAQTILLESEKEVPFFLAF